METFGIDEPAGNYDDMHHSYTIMLWGANMAEMHPVLWSKITNRKLADTKRVKVVNLTTFTNRCTNLADSEIVFKPNTDLAIQNYILREIVNRPGAVDWGFVNQNCVFTTGYVDIGYGLRPKIDHPKYRKEELDTASKESFKIITKDEAVAMGALGMKAGDRMEMKNTGKAGVHWAVSFEDFKKGLEPYTLDFVAPLAKGNADEPLDAFKKKLAALADLYVEKDRKVVSFWTMDEQLLRHRPHPYKAGNNTGIR